MKRVSDPEIRKRQILDAAMKLFYEKGYENTSMADIAKEMDITKGLCYRYYESKQALFQSVIEEYAGECCEGFLSALQDRSKDMKERLTGLLAGMIHPEEGKYHDFFHKPGNEMIHDLITVTMCRYMLPHVETELQDHFKGTDRSADEISMTAQYLVFGQIGLQHVNSRQAGAAAAHYGMMLDRLLGQG